MRRRESRRLERSLFKVEVYIEIELPDDSSMRLLNWDSTRVSIWAMCAWTQCLSSLRLKACFDEFARFNFPCTIDCTVEYFWCGDEPRIDHSSFSPRGGIKYQVFDIPLLPFFASICTASILAASSLALCGRAFEFHRRHGGSRPIDQSPACSVDVSRKERVPSVPIVSSSEHQVRHRLLAVGETSVDSSLVDTRRPTQTKRRAGRYSTW